MYRRVQTTAAAACCWFNGEELEHHSERFRASELFLRWRSRVGAYFARPPVRPPVIGTLVALALLAVATAGLQQLGVPLWVSPVFDVVALLIAIGLAASREPAEGEK